MRNRLRSKLTLLITLLGVCPLSWGLEQSMQDQVKEVTPYQTAIRLPLSQTSNGIDGYLELRQDGRLTQKLTGRLWGTGDVDIDDDPVLTVFKNDPPRNAVIRMVDHRGKVVESKELERPLAKLRTEHLYGDSRLTYLLTVDYSAGFGSYSGPITRLAEVTGGRLKWIESTELKTGKTEQISLMESLKTTWKFVDGLDGKGNQILLAQCRPDWSSAKEDPVFITTFARFYFDGAKWVVKARVVKGFNEFDQGFPSRRNFP